MAVSVAAKSDEWSFLVMGDWGGSEDYPYSTSQEIATAGGMDKIAGKGIDGTDAAPPKFALALGDNFYSHGIGGDCHDARFVNTFEKVFTGENLQDPFVFHVVAGNHDHIGNVSAQIAYSDLSKRWSFPTYYYSFVETGPASTSKSVEVVYIDTVLLGGNSDVLDENGEHLRELRGSELPGPADKAKANAQLVWLESTLKASTADYLIVGGHYPIYSICEHGPTSELITDVKPLLEKYNVTAYIAGHDHCMEYLTTGDGLDHHGIGSAHENDPSTAHSTAVPANSLKWHNEGTDGGFASFEVKATGLVVRHHQGDGSVAFVTPPHPPRK